MTTPLGPGPGTQIRMAVYNSHSAEIPQGYAVQLDVGAEFAAHKFLDDSLDYDQICVELATGARGCILGIAEKAIPVGAIGEIVTMGLVKCHADDTIVIDDPLVVVDGGKCDNEGGTGLHSDAYFGTWLEAVTAETLGQAFVWFSPTPLIAI